MHVTLHSGNIKNWFDHLQTRILHEKCLLALPYLWGSIMHSHQYLAQEPINGATRANSAIRLGLVIGLCFRFQRDFWVDINSRQTRLKETFVLIDPNRKNMLVFHCFIHLLLPLIQAKFTSSCNTSHCRRNPGIQNMLIRMPTLPWKLEPKIWTINISFVALFAPMHASQHWSLSLTDLMARCLDSFWRMGWTVGSRMTWGMSWCMKPQWSPFRLIILSPWFSTFKSMLELLGCLNYTWLDTRRRLKTFPRIQSPPDNPVDRHLLLRHGPIQAFREFFYGLLRWRFLEDEVQGQNSLRPSVNLRGWNSIFTVPSLWQWSKNNPLNCMTTAVELDGILVWWKVGSFSDLTRQFRYGESGLLSYKLFESPNQRSGKRFFSRTPCDLTRRTGSKEFKWSKVS